MTTVLHVISGLGMGGAERMLFQAASVLQKRGLAQHVVSIGSHGGYAEQLEAHGVPVTLLEVKSAARGPRGLSRLAALLREVQPQVIQGWMYHGNVLAALAHRLAAGRATRRLFWNLRASNMDDARYGWLIRAGAWLSRWPDVVIANSQVGLAYHIGRGFCPRHFEVIPNGIDVESFRPNPEARKRMRAQLGIDPDAVVAIHIARVDPMKDHAMFLAAMQRLPDISGILVGAGTDALKAPPNVRALGARHDVAELCVCADLIVSTSAFGEGFSNVIAEGMSAGLFPIVTDVGDSRLITGSIGSVVTPGDVDALSAAIAAAAGLPETERQARGLQARNQIVENFTLEKSIDAYLRLYATA